MATRSWHYGLRSDDTYCLFWLTLGDGYETIQPMSKITAYARGMDCQVRVPQICSHSPESVVMAHYRMAGLSGMGQKPSDIFVAIACSECHDAIDGRTKSHHTRDALRLFHAEGVFRTQYLLKLDGLI